MSWVVVAVGGVAGMQILSANQQANAIRENAKLTKQVMDMNAEYAELDAYNAELQGLAEEARYSTVIDQTLGAQEVAFAANDVDVTFGTAKEIVEETKITGMLNAMDIKNVAQARAMGFKREARDMRINGALGINQASTNASATQAAGVIGAATTVTGYMAGKGGK